MLVPPNESHEAALYTYPIGAEDARLIGGIGSFERDRVAAPTQALQCGLLFVNKCHDDIAVARVLTLAHDDGIAIEDAGIDHRISFDLERKMLTLGEQLRGHLDGVRAGLDGLDGHTGGNAAHDRHADGLRQALSLGHLRNSAQASLNDAWREAAGPGCA